MKIGFATVILVLCGYLFFLLSDSPSLSSPIYLEEVAEKSSPKQWYKDWGSNNKIHNVMIIRDEPDLLEVKIIYKYSGDKGREIFTCGGIGIRKNHINWSCKPSKIKVGETLSILRFQTSNNAKEVMCSKYVVVSMYPSGGSPILHKYYKYEKVWLKEKTGFINILKQKITSCET